MFACYLHVARLCKPTHCIEQRIKQTQQEQAKIQRDLDARKGQLEEYQSEEKAPGGVKYLEKSLEKYRRELDKLEKILMKRKA